MPLVKSVSTPQLRGILEKKFSSSSLTDQPTVTVTRPQISRSVSFAPLPEIKKKKKGSRPPLGIANRSAILRRRMRTYDSAFPDDYPSENGTTVTFEGAEDVTGEHVEKLRQLRISNSGTEHSDPVVVFGRIVKEASKSFWRKLSAGGDGTTVVVARPVGDSKHVDATDTNGDTALEPSVQVVSLDLDSASHPEREVWEEGIHEPHQGSLTAEKELPPPPHLYSPNSSLTTSPSQNSDCSSAISTLESSVSDASEIPHPLHAPDKGEFSTITHSYQDAVVNHTNAGS